MCVIFQIPPSTTDNNDAEVAAAAMKQLEMLMPNVSRIISDNRYYIYFYHIYNYDIYNFVV